MKFTIDGSTFKSAIDRIKACVPKKSTVHSLEHVKITSDMSTNTVTLEAYDSDDYAKISTYATCAENGFAFVHIDDLSKLTGLTGDITISAEKNDMEVHGKKKSHRIRYNDLFTIDYPTVELGETKCTFKELELLKHLGNLDCFREVGDINVMMKSFHFDFKKGNIVALNGHAIGIASFGLEDTTASENINVNGEVYKKLKGVAGKTKDKEREVSIIANKKYVKFVGEDYEVVSRLIDVKYFDYNSLLQSNSLFDYNYSVDCKELLGVCKEYCKIIGKERLPMFVVGKNGKIATGISTGTYETSDLIESVKELTAREYFYQGFNPKYIANACSVFEGDVTVHGYYDNKRPVWFTNDEYKIMILPVNINKVGVTFVEKQIA